MFECTSEEKHSLNPSWLSLVGAGRSARAAALKRTLPYAPKISIRNLAKQPSSHEGAKSAIAFSCHTYCVGRWNTSRIPLQESFALASQTPKTSVRFRHLCFACLHMQVSVSFSMGPAHFFPNNLISCPK